MDDHDPERLIAEAVTSHREGRLEEAVAAYRALLRLMPGSAEVHCNLGAALKGLNRLDDAAAAYGHAIALKPGYPAAYSNLGEALLALGRFDEAEAACRRAIACHPGPPQAYNNLGVALDRLGRTDEAMAAYGQAIALAPDYAAAHCNLGMALDKSEDTVRALGHFETAAALPDAPMIAHSYLASARAGLGLIAEAADGLAAALKRQPGIPGGDDLLHRLQDGPFFPPSGLQGRHAPERQVYMAAAVCAKRALERPLRILEIGSYMGASLLTWAAAAVHFTTGTAEITCIDPWEGAAPRQYARTMRDSLATGAAYRLFLNTARHVDHRVTVRPMVGTSDDVLPTLDGPFDIIYIDGCHLYPYARNDILSCHRLLEDGGYICGDDLERQLSQTDPRLVMDNIGADCVTDAQTGTIFHPGVTRAVGEIFGDVSVYRGFWIMERVGEGYRPVSLRGMRGRLPRHWPADMHREIRDNIAADGVLSGVD